MLKNVSYFRDRSRTLFTVSSLRCSFFFLRPLRLGFSSSSSPLPFLPRPASSSLSDHVSFGRRCPLCPAPNSSFSPILFVRFQTLRPAPSFFARPDLIPVPRPRSCAPASFLCLRPRFCGPGSVRGPGPAWFSLPLRPCFCGPGASCMRLRRLAACAAAYCPSISFR